MWLQLKRFSSFYRPFKTLIKTQSRLFSNNSTNLTQETITKIQNENNVKNIENTNGQINENNKENGNGQNDVGKLVDSRIDREKLIFEQAHRILEKRTGDEIIADLDEDSEKPSRSLELIHSITSRTIDGLMKELNYKSFPIKILETPDEIKNRQIPSLKNGLEHVIQNDCLLTRDALNSIIGMDVANFYSNIPLAEEIDFNQIGEYTKPSNDKILTSLAAKKACEYIMSTSTITNLLVHTDYLLTSFKSPVYQGLSHEYSDQPLRFIISTRKPNSAFATLVSTKPRIIAIDNDGELFDNKRVIFMTMGKYLEAMLTHTKADFDRKFLIKNKRLRLPSDKPSNDYFSYMHAGKIILRSQIDSGMMQNGKLRKIEIKTRAVTPQRYDSRNYKDYTDYHLIKDIGILESYEREYYDLIRGGFMKYVHQMEIGDMDSVIIAYHNTKEIFGFEHFKRSHLEKRVYGTEELAHICFRSSLLLTQNIFDYIFSQEELVPGNTLKIGFYAHHRMNALFVLVETIDNLEEYKKKLTEKLPLNDLSDIVDYYNTAKIVPKVNKYIVRVSRRLNGVDMPSKLSILFEPKDHLEFTYDIKKVGKVSYQEYMQFLHENNKSEYKNVESEYSGSWPIF